MPNQTYKIACNYNCHLIENNYFLVCLTDNWLYLLPPPLASNKNQKSLYLSSLLARNKKKIFLTPSLKCFLKLNQENLFSLLFLLEFIAFVRATLKIFTIFMLKNCNWYSWPHLVLVVYKFPNQFSQGLDWLACCRWWWYGGGQAQWACATPHSSRYRSADLTNLQQSIKIYCSNLPKSTMVG